MIPFIEEQFKNVKVEATIVATDGSQGEWTRYLPIHLKAGDTISGIAPNTFLKILRWNYNTRTERYIVIVEEIDVKSIQEQSK